ncbi:MAG: RNA polymerase sigma-70 factor [Bacteroidota bacterium]
MNTRKNIAIDKIFRQIYDEYHHKVYFFAYKRLKDKQIAEDLVQSVFLKIWEHQTALKQGKINEAFLLATARNLLIDMHRKKVFDTVSLTIQSDAQDMSEEENDISTEDKMKYVQSAIEELPERRRRIFLLSRQQGLTYKEIAEEMSISPKTVENQISRALKSLRHKLSHLFIGLLF